MSTYPNNVQHHTGYADDVHAAESSLKPQIAATALTAYAEGVGHWVRERELQISAPKSYITLFTSDIRQFHLHPTVEQNNTPLPLERRPKLIGVTFDIHRSFTPISKQ